VVGGVTSVRDMLSPARLQEFKTKIEEVKQFVDRAYQADILMAADAFKTEPSVLGGCNVRNFMSTDELFTGNGNAMLGGYIQNSDLSNIADLNKDLIKEDITHSWYKGDKPLNPFNGETIPEYTDMIERDTVYGKLPTLNENGKYSWVKAPRYNGEPVEVGPLASVLVNYAKGQPFVKQAVDELLQATGLPVTALFTTLGRTAARMLNCRHAIAAVEETWESLVANVMGDETTYVLPQLDKNKEYKGMVFRLAPRGVLSHWVRIKDGLVENYQAVVPTTWNASPIDGNGKVAPYEASLVGLKLEDPKKPLEVLRVIHSFDPCMACAVHVMDYQGNELSQFRIDPNGL
jgi:quinone-reactive Ni/Fe-hydrogenase large subunit